MRSLSLFLTTIFNKIEKLSQYFNLNKNQFSENFLDRITRSENQILEPLKIKISSHFIALQSRCTLSYNLY